MLNWFKQLFNNIFNFFNEIQTRKIFYIFDSIKTHIKNFVIKKPTLTNNIELYWLRLIFKKNFNQKLLKESRTYFNAFEQFVLCVLIFILLMFICFFLYNALCLNFNNFRHNLNFYAHKSYIHSFFFFEWLLHSSLFKQIGVHNNQKIQEAPALKLYFILNRGAFLRGPNILDILSIERGRSFWHIYLNDYGILLESNWIKKIYNKSSNYGWVGWHYDSNTEVTPLTTLGRSGFQATFFSKKWPKNPTLTHHISYKAEDSKKFAHQLNRFYASLLENLRLFRRERGFFKIGTIVDQNFLTFKPLYRRVMQQYVVQQQKIIDIDVNNKLIKRQPFSIKLKIRNLTKDMHSFSPLIIHLNLTSKISTRWNTVPIFNEKHVMSTSIYAPDLKFLRKRTEYEIKAKLNTPAKRTSWYKLVAEAGKKRFYARYINPKSRIWIDIYRTLLLYKHRYKEIWPMRYAAFSYVATPIVYNLADAGYKKEGYMHFKSAKGIFYKEQIHVLNEIFDIHSFRFRFYVPFQQIANQFFTHKWFTSHALSERARSALYDPASYALRTRIAKQSNKYYKNVSIFQTLGTYLIPKRKTFLDTLYWFQYYLVPRQVLLSYYRIAYTSRRQHKRYKQVWNVFSKYKQRNRLRRVLNLRKHNYTKLDFLLFNKFETFPDWMHSWYLENRKSRGLLKKRRHEILKVVNRLTKKPTRDEPTVDINTKRGYCTVGERSFFRWNAYYHNFIRYSQLWRPKAEYNVFLRTKNIELKRYKPEPFLLLKPYKQSFLGFRDKMRVLYKPIFIQLRYASPHYIQHFFDIFEKNFHKDNKNKKMYDFLLDFNINFIIEWKRKFLIKNRYRVTYVPQGFNLLWSCWMFLFWSRIMSEGEGSPIGPRESSVLLPIYNDFYVSNFNLGSALGIFYKINQHMDALTWYITRPRRDLLEFWQDHNEPIWFQDSRPMLPAQFRLGNSMLLTSHFNFNLYRFAGSKVGSYFNLFCYWFPYLRLVNFWSLPFEEQLLLSKRKHIIYKEMLDEFLDFELSKKYYTRQLGENEFKWLLYDYSIIYKLDKGRWHLKRKKIWGIRVGDIFGTFGSRKAIGQHPKVEGLLVCYIQTVLRSILYKHMFSKLFGVSLIDLPDREVSLSFTKLHHYVKSKVNVSSFMSYFFFYNTKTVKWLSWHSGISFFGGSFENVLNRGANVHEMRVKAMASEYLHAPYLNVKSRYHYILLMHIPHGIVKSYVCAMQRLHLLKKDSFFTTYGVQRSITKEKEPMYLFTFSEKEQQTRAYMFNTLQFLYFTRFLKNSVDLFLLSRNNRGINKRFLFDCHFDHMYFCLTHKNNLLFFHSDSILWPSCYNKYLSTTFSDNFRYSILSYGSVLSQRYLPFQSKSKFTNTKDISHSISAFTSMRFWYNMNVWAQMFTTKALLKTTDTYDKYSNSFYYFFYPYVRKIRGTLNKNLKKNQPNFIGYSYILQSFIFAFKRRTIIERDYTPVFPVRDRDFNGLRGMLSELLIPWPDGYLGLVLAVSAGTGIPAMRKHSSYLPQILKTASFRHVLLSRSVFETLLESRDIQWAHRVLKRDRRYFAHKFLLIQFFKFKKLFETCVASSTTRFEVEISGGKCFRHWYIGRVRLPMKAFSIFPHGDFLISLTKRIFQSIYPKSKIYRYSITKGLKRRELYSNLIYKLADYTTYKYNEPDQIKFFYTLCASVSRNLRGHAPLINILTHRSSTLNFVCGITSHSFAVKFLQSLALLFSNENFEFFNVVEGDGYFLRSTRFYFRRFMGSKVGLDFNNFYAYSERSLFMHYLNDSFKKRGGAPAYT